MYLIYTILSDQFTMFTPLVPTVLVPLSYQPFINETIINSIKIFRNFPNVFLNAHTLFIDKVKVVGYFSK
jgi:hypothetical protein